MKHRDRPDISKLKQNQYCTDESKFQEMNIVEA